MRRLFFNRLLAPIAPFVAGQLSGPRGWFGRVVMARLLDLGNRELITAALDALDVAPGAALLDVGFGGGIALALAARRGATVLAGADPSESAVAAASRRLARLEGRATVRLIRASAAALPFPDAAFDRALSTNAVYFWPELRSPMAELARVLRPSGRLVIGFADAEKLASYGPITRHGFAHWRAAEIARAVEDAGFARVRLVPLTGPSTRGDYLAIADKTA